MLSCQANLSPIYVIYHMYAFCTLEYLGLCSLLGFCMLLNVQLNGTVAQGVGIPAPHLTPWPAGGGQRKPPGGAYILQPHLCQLWLQCSSLPSSVCE